MGALRRLLKPTVLIKRKFIRSGVFGGDRKWLAIGGAVIMGGKIKRLFGFGVPAPVYVEELKEGQRFVVAHDEPTSRRKRRKARKTANKMDKKTAKKAAKQAGKAGKVAAKAAKKAAKKAA